MSTYFPLIHMGSITALRCATARISLFQVATDKIFSQNINRSKDNFVRIGGLRRILSRYIGKNGESLKRIKKITFFRELRESV